MLKPKSSLRTSKSFVDKDRTKFNKVVKSKDRASLTISPPKLSTSKELSSPKSQPSNPHVYFAFEYTNIFNLLYKNDAKLTYFNNKLVNINCKLIIDDEIASIFDMRFDKENYITIYGSYSKLFELFKLVKYVNIVRINTIKTQMKIAHNDNVLLLLPLINDPELNRTFEDDHNILSSLLSPRAEQQLKSQTEINIRKEQEEEAYQAKIAELNARHQKFLEENGLTNNMLSPRSSIKNMMQDTFKKINERGEKLQHLANETQQLECNSYNLLQNAKLLNEK